MELYYCDFIDETMPADLVADYGLSTADATTACDTRFTNLYT
jgi:hypothetical protein